MIFTSLFHLYPGSSIKIKDAEANCAETGFGEGKSATACLPVLWARLDFTREGY